MNVAKAAEVPRPLALIADDQADVLEALRLLLKGEGFLIEAVNSPKGILEALAGKSYDVLLMDLNYARDTTSGQEGLDLLAGIHELDGTLPVVVMTAWGTIDIAVEAMRRGVGDFVQKPWENSRLLSTLRKQIELGKAVRKRERMDAITRRLSVDILEVSDVQALLKLVAEGIQQAMQSRSVVIFSKALSDRTFAVSATADGSDEMEGKLKFDPESKLLTMMDIVLDVRKNDLPAEERSKLRDANCAMLFPVKVKGDLVGFINVGRKLSGEEYEADDTKFLATAVEQIEVGINHLHVKKQALELEQAREIQQRLLPTVIPQIPGYEIYTAWQPVSAVGGDYFDALKFSDTRLGLCIGDVAGKGMPAALLMSNLQASVKAFAAESTQPKDLCEKVNGMLCGSIGSDKFITFFYCLLDAPSRKLIYTNAGHNAPLLLRRDGSVEKLEDGGAVLGVFPKWCYDQGELELSSGDRVLLFTDGVTEVRNTQDEEFGDDRLIDLLSENRSLAAGELQAKVMEAVSAFSGGNFQDDVTLIVMSVE